MVKTLLIGLLTLTTGSFSYRKADQGVATLVSKTFYEQLFPHHAAIYTYEAFIKAAETFPSFAGEGSPETRKRELAAFFAHIAHETGNARPGEPYAWGLYYTEEQACKDGHCTVYNTAGDSHYKPVPGKAYFGRGPLQLTYAYNYGLAGQELGIPLLAHPELAATDGVIAFKTAIWFWMKAQDPEPSCHAVICGLWQPSSLDLRLKRKPGFGMTINVINGAVECNSKVPAIRAEREERINLYRYMASQLHITVEKDCDCAGMGIYP